MSLMSAAEAREVAGASPDVRPTRLQIARSASRAEDAGTGHTAAAGAPPGAGSQRPASGHLTQGQAALRVRHVRVVRQVSVRSRRASGPRSVTAAPAWRPVPSGAAGQAARPGRVVGGAGLATGPGRVVGGAGQAAGPGRVVGGPVRAGGPALASEATATPAPATRRTRVTSQTVPGGCAQRWPGPVRLTRRGRRVVAGLAILVIAAVVTVLVIAAAGSVRASSHAAAPGSAYRGMTQVVVQPGQTLWSIAAAAEPSGNAWAVVQQIINVNALTSVEVQAGQLLWVPRG
jgi:hypothetical protein